MKISEEIQNLKPYSPGKPIDETKRELGLDKVYKLASNENPLGPSDRVIEALKRELSEMHRYPDAGFYELREAFSKKYDLDSSWFTFGNGSNEIIDLLIRAFCAPGEAVLSSENAFVAYGICTQAARARFLTAPMTDDMKFDLKAMAVYFKENNQAKNIRLVFIANPNNPTGTYVSQQELSDFVDEFKDEKETLIVIDEAYLEFVTANDFPDAMSLLRENPNVLITRTMSKVYGLAGIRVGALIGRPEWIDYIDRIRNPFNVNSLAQRAAIVSLDDYDYLKAVQKVNAQGLDYFYSEFSALGLKHWKSQTNFVLVEPDIDGQKLYKGLLQKGVIVRPMPLKPGKTFLRISVGTREENEACVQALRSLL